MADYQLTAGASVIRESDGGLIPGDPANADYQDYLTWLAAGNTPDPVPVVTVVPPTAISVAAFWARFTPTEQAGVATAASANPQVTAAMTLALVAGQVNLNGNPVITGWMALLVAAGAVTPARSVTILTP